MIVLVVALGEKEDSSSKITALLDFITDYCCQDIYQMFKLKYALISWLSNLAFINLDKGPTQHPQITKSRLETFDNQLEWYFC